MRRAPPAGARRISVVCEFVVKVGGVKCKFLGFVVVQSTYSVINFWGCLYKVGLKILVMGFVVVVNCGGFLDP